MIPYIIFIVSIVFIGFIEFENKKIKYILIATIITIFLAVRYEVGWDFSAYYTLAEENRLSQYPIFFDANDYNWDPLLYQYWRMEFLNKILYKFVWAVNLPQLIIVLYSFITIFFLYKGLSNQKKMSIEPWIFFICIPIFMLSFTSLMRQGVAATIVFYSYKYIKKDEKAKFLFCILLATLFHETAVYAVVLYLLKYVGFIGKIPLLLVFGVGIILQPIYLKILALPIFSNYFHYVTGGIGEGGKIISFLIIGITLFVIVFSDKLIINNKDNIFYIYAVVIGGIIYISLVDLGHIGPRASVYFYIFILYLISDIVNVFKPKIVSKILFCCICISLFNVYLFFDSSKERTQFVPYKVADFKIIRGE